MRKSHPIFYLNLSKTFRFIIFSHKKKMFLCIFFIVLFLIFNLLFQFSKNDTQDINLYDN